MIHPELEGGLELVRHTLLTLGFSASQVQPYTDAMRRDQYDLALSTLEERQVLDHLLTWSTNVVSRSEQHEDAGHAEATPRQRGARER